MSNKAEMLKKKLTLVKNNKKSPPNFDLSHLKGQELPFQVTSQTLNMVQRKTELLEELKSKTPNKDLGELGVEEPPEEKKEGPKIFTFDLDKTGKIPPE